MVIRFTWFSAYWGLRLPLNEMRIGRSYSGSRLSPKASSLSPLILVDFQISYTMVIDESSIFMLERLATMLIRVGERLTT